MPYSWSDHSLITYYLIAYYLIAYDLIAYYCSVAQVSREKKKGDFYNIFLNLSLKTGR